VRQTVTIVLLIINNNNRSNDPPRRIYTVSASCSIVLNGYLYVVQMQEMKTAKTTLARVCRINTTIGKQKIKTKKSNGMRKEKKYIHLLHIIIIIFCCWPISVFLNSSEGGKKLLVEIIFKVSRYTSEEYNNIIVINSNSCNRVSLK